ncbi:microtubule associated protein-domain-containing protein [Gaertneriomyces semiglobifer]|nr:microtubule associated protein-domain-containing protein [Gaertneriomyces semiglobifer]
MLTVDLSPSRRTQTRRSSSARLDCSSPKHQVPVRFFTPPRAASHVAWNELDEKPFALSAETTVGELKDDQSQPDHARQLLENVKTELLRLGQLWTEALDDEEAIPDSNWDTRMNDIKKIMDAVSEAISDEQVRREQVIREVVSTRADLQANCELLEEEIPEEMTSRSRLNPYQILCRLKRMSTRVDALACERRKELESLRAEWKRLRESLTDIEEAEVASFPERLSLRALQEARFIVDILQAERDLRLDALAEAVLQLLQLCRSLDCPVPEPYTLCLDALSKADSQQDLVLEKVRASLDSDVLPSPLDFSREAIHDLLYACETLRTEQEGLLSRLDDLLKEIQMFWDQLKTPENAKKNLVRDIKRIQEYADLSEELRILWRRTMEEKVDSLRTELIALWQQCHVPQVERDTFSQKVEENLYSPLTVELLTDEIARLTARFEEYRALYKQVEDRADLIQKMIDFEVTASDPKRLFRPSFQLLEEEKFRKTCFPTLLRLEDSLRKGIAAMEAETGQPFICDGERYLDRLAKEVSERFVNESVFVIDLGVDGAATSNRPQTPARARRSLLVNATGTSSHVTPKPSSIRRSTSTSAIGSQARAKSPTPTLRRTPSRNLSSTPSIRGVTSSGAGRIGTKLGTGAGQTRR